MNIISKWKYKILALVLAMVFVVGGFLSLKTSFVSEHPLVKTFIPPKADLEFQAPKLHYYDNPSVSLERVHVQAFFVVPRNSLNQIPLSWKSDFNKALDKMKKFHANQFGESSILTYSLLDVPVITDESLFGLIPREIDGIKEIDLSPLDRFIEDNVLKPGAPFYHKNFAEVSADAYSVKVMFIAAPAAMGSEGLVIISNDFITDPAIPYGISILYHEFGHALGIPDFYDYETGEALSDNIMGSGRYRLIEYSFVGEQIKQKMGVK